MLTQIYGPQPFAPDPSEQARVPGLDLAGEERKHTPEGTRDGKIEVQMFEDARLASARETEERKGDVVAEEPEGGDEESIPRERNIHSDKRKGQLEQEIAVVRAQIEVVDEDLTEA